MFEQAPPPQNEDQTKIENYVDLMEMIDMNLTTAPSFGEGVSAMVAAVPYYAIISRFCNTPAGYDAFTSFRSQSEILQEGGWIGTAALNAMVQSAGGNPDDPHYGFKSYDALFVGELKAGHRAVTHPDNSAIVNSACSSTVFQLFYNFIRQIDWKRVEF
ncbi:hypothetical protein EDC04DRAFT_2897827 [Pisolithus marmoratus]|nr:hypothetical protein EDC04DRAFT_2897827 [Pisolithus marmoratus]